MRYVFAVMLLICMYVSAGQFTLSQEAEKSKPDLKSKGCAIIENMASGFGNHDSVTHKPSDDIHHGNHRGAFRLPDKMTIPIAVDVLEYMNIDVPQGIEGESNIANIDVYMDGRVVYNGQDVTGKMYEMCDEPVEPDASQDILQNPEIIENKED